MFLIYVILTSIQKYWMGTSLTSLVYMNFLRQSGFNPGQRTQTAVCCPPDSISC